MPGGAVDVSDQMEFSDADFRLVAKADQSKKVAFDLSGLTTATTRIYTAPDKAGTLALTSDITGGVTTIASAVSVGTGSSLTISGLTLTTYKFLRLVLKGASVATGTQALNLNSNTMWNVTTVARAQVVDIDLTSGIFFAGSGNLNAADSGLSTASTSITLTLAASTFNAGTYYLYGIK